MRSLFALLGVAACAGDPTAVEVELSPSVISSLDGTTTVTALVVTDTTPLADTAVRLSATYTDRNGMPHAIDPIDGRTDDRGVFRASLAGLTFDGVGTVTVEATQGIAGEATFVVLDRTPPTVEIVPPTAGNKVGPGLPVIVQVHATDEIGVAEVTFDGTDVQARSTVVSSGTVDATIDFFTTVSANATGGQTIELHALARDLSGNIGVAPPLTLEVDPTITIATPPDLAGGLLVDGSATQLASPRSIVVSPMDGHLYIADLAGVGACNPSCIWRVDAATGAIDATPVVVGQGTIEGVAVDTDGSHLFFTDRDNRTGQLTWNGTAYANPVACSDAAQQRPQTPFHLVSDPTLGLLVADDNSQDVVRVATCSAATVGTDFSTNGNFDAPRGIALGATGEIYVSDQNNGDISLVDRTTGAVSRFSGVFEEPFGLEWLGTGTSAWANQLMVADSNRRIVAATTGPNLLAAAFFRNPPIDLAFAGDAMFVITAPSNNNRGRLYKVTGF